MDAETAANDYRQVATSEVERLRAENERLRAEIAATNTLAVTLSMGGATEIKAAGIKVIGLHPSRLGDTEVLDLWTSTPADSRSRWQQYLKTRVDYGVLVYAAVSVDLFRGREVYGLASLVVPPAGVLLGTPVAYVEDVVVHPAMRRRGIGRALVEHCVAKAKELRIEEVKLFCSPTLAGWYERMGFRRAAEVTMRRAV